jgi:hypothetical protein
MDMDMNSMEHIITSSAESPTSSSQHDDPGGSTQFPALNGSVTGTGTGTGTATGPGTPISPRYIVRAQFDFDASDPSALSFKSGDVIEVYTMLESGWWDGMLDGRRGWFPSNFVEELNEEDDQDQDQDQDGQGESSSRHGHGQDQEHDEHTHGLGLVGDQMDRERDMKTLEQDQFGVPSRHRRNLSSTSGIDDLAGAGWGSGGLDDLAREMMDSSLQGEELEDDGKAFEAEALRRRKFRDSDDTSGDGGDFGTLKTPYSRRREETDNTIRQNSRAGPSRPGTSGKAKEGMEDAWIPSLTPDGQVSLASSLTENALISRCTTSIPIRMRLLGRSLLPHQLAKDQEKDQEKKKISTIPTIPLSTIHTRHPPNASQGEMGITKLLNLHLRTTSTGMLVPKNHSDFHLILMAKSLILGYPECRMMEKDTFTIIE